jgi:hypothetical protein
MTRAKNREQIGRENCLKRDPNTSEDLVYNRGWVSD